MKRTALILLFSLISAGLSFVVTGCSEDIQADLATGFKLPQKETRPWCYYISFNGHFDKPTIDADIARMASIGFGGVLFTDISGYHDGGEEHLNLPKREKEWMGKEWLSDLKHLARRLNEHTYKVFDVEISMPEGQPVRGYMAMPVNAVAKSLPVLLYTHSAGVARYENRATIERAVKFAKRGNGVVALDINAHGFMNDRPQNYYDELDKGVLKNYRADNLTSRENYYFRLMILRLVRAMDFLCSLPQWDGTRAVVYGESQGGFQAAALAGLDSRVTFAMMNVPAHMDIGSPLQGRKAAWPGIYDKGMKTNPELVNKILPYFDAANFLRHIKAKLVFEAGLVDETCPPGCVFAGYNVCSSTDKHIFIYPYRPHVPGNMQIDKIEEWKINVDIPKHKLLDDYLR